MNLYYLRAIPADWDTMIQLGTTLGAVETVTDEEGNTSIQPTLGGAWDYIGEIHQPTGNMLTDAEGLQYPETAPITNPDGIPYLHANLMTPLSLGEVANAMAVANPDIAAGLAELGKYFLLDAEGNARLPTQPHRVFA